MERWGRMKQKNSLFSKAKKESADTQTMKKNVSEMQTWMRNLEQQISSVGARLTAVENRITNYKKKKPGKHEEDNSIFEINASLHSTDDQTILKMNKFEKDVQSLHQSVSKINSEITQLESFRKDSLNKLTRLEGYSRPQSMIMRIGKKEIPLELTGIIGGTIAFLVAGLVMVDATDIVVNPWFLGSIGSLFIGSSFLRTQSGNRFLEKMSVILPFKSTKNSVHHSDSTS